MLFVKHVELVFSRVYLGGEFGDGDIQKTLGKVVFFVFNCINSFKKRS